MKKVISSPLAPAAIGPYSQATEAAGLVFVSGQLPIDAATGENNCLPAGHESICRHEQCVCHFL